MTKLAQLLKEEMLAMLNYEAYESLTDNQAFEALATRLSARGVVVVGEPTETQPWLVPK